MIQFVARPVINIPIESIVPVRSRVDFEPIRCGRPVKNNPPKAIAPPYADIDQAIFVTSVLRD
ncbi:hypothetical protein GCM10009084_22070 [Marinomonas primoryensis]